MRLLVISNMPHYRRGDGRIVGWGPTVQELDHLATRFSSVRHIAPLHDDTAPPSSLAYTDDRVELVPMRPTGGDTLRAKFDVLGAMPHYAAVMLRELREADVVHLRCPANLPMLAAALLPFVRRPRGRWIKYAGDWKPKRRSSLPFAFQRWLLTQPWHRGTVTVNGTWPGQPAHVRSFFNPSLTDEELARANSVSESKRLVSPVRVLFVGRLETNKGVDVALDAFARFLAFEESATLDLVGDGHDRVVLERRAGELGIASRTTFHGFLDRRSLPDVYARAHLLLFPSLSEGWPKVLSEGMAYGVVPVTSAVGAIPEYLTRFDVGRALEAIDADVFAEALADYVRQPSRWLEESLRGRKAAVQFSYSHYLTAIDELLGDMRVGD